MYIVLWPILTQISFRSSGVDASSGKLQMHLRPRLGPSQILLRPQRRLCGEERIEQLFGFMLRRVNLQR